MKSPEKLYQAIILQHYREPYHHYEIENADFSTMGRNPRCGDQMTIYFKLVDNVIGEMSFLAQSCAVATASASLMVQELEGKKEQEATQLVNRMDAFFGGEEIDQELIIPNLKALTSVLEFPARMKCAQLPWKAAKLALSEKKELGSVSTE